MRLRELLRDIEIISAAVDLDTEVRGLCYDSRRAKPGDAFVAIEGYESDGHDYIAQALEAGAAAVMCTKPQPVGIPFVLVESTRCALAIASGNFFGSPASRMKLIGVTGTNGKTTVSTLMKQVIETITGAKAGLIGTNRNMIGEVELETERTTPESYDLHELLRKMADAGCEYVVMEVSSHALALSRVEGIEFEVGVFTNLTQDHLDFHGSMEDYARAKGKLFKMCRHGCVNIDNEFAEYITRGAACDISTFSIESNAADIVAKDIKLLGGGVKFCAVSMGMIERVSLQIPGTFSVYNALAVISAGLALGFESADISSALANARGVTGRMEVVPTGEDYTVIIDYAHTPDALENALTALREGTRGRLVALFGCGGDRDKAKRAQMGEIAVRLADYTIVTSDNPRTEEPRAIIDDILAGIKGARGKYAVIEDRREAIAYALEYVKPEDIILLAGKGHETYQIVGKTKHHMDEREIVASILAQKKQDIKE